MNKTIIYYTSNREYQSFERSIQQTIIENSNGIPIISVSQKPIDFGENICIGDIGTSELNILRQIRIGAVCAKTDFVIPCESDILYPPDFFSFNPTRLNTFYYANLAYIIWHNTDTFYKKKMQEFTSIVSRKYLIEKIDYLINNMGDHFPLILRRIANRKTFDAGAPLITTKTNRQLHKRHPHAKTGVKSVPYWGTGIELWKKYKCED